MERVPVDDVDPDPHPVGVNENRRDLTDAVDADHITVTRYELDPGESVSAGLYTYRDREEIFYIAEGVMTFEHHPRDGAGEPNHLNVEANELVRFTAGEYRCGRNTGTKPVVGIVFAARPPLSETERMESLAPCRLCEELTAHRVTDPDDAYRLTCTVCGTEMRLG
ncbi:cupin [Natronomonas sp.]|uniref:cupin n=1 Tax=Natronomonas sp. TaxID=2184060 RepID=UPI0039767C37